MRFALKVGYIGTDYHGFQRQPCVNTIEGELLRSLIELDIIKDPYEANYMASGRTDKGVHALGQVVAFDTNAPDLSIPRAINSHLPGAIWTWARAQVPHDFDPRRNAKSRKYMYIMQERLDHSLLADVPELMIGEHDFSNFITPEKERSSSTTLYDLSIRTFDDLTIIEICGSHFLWHMVRKIANAIRMIGGGTRDIKWLEKMLTPALFYEPLSPAPAYGLILKNVEYVGIHWKVDDYAKKKTMKNLGKEFSMHSVMAGMLKELKEYMN